MLQILNLKFTIGHFADNHIIYYQNTLWVKPQFASQFFNLD